MSASPALRVHLWPETYGVAKLRALPAEGDWLRADGPPIALVTGHDEISVVAPEAVIDALGELVEEAGRGWRALTLDAVFSLSTVGLLAAASRALAAVDVPLMVISSHDTDHLLVPGALLGRALSALHQADLERFV